MATTKITNEVIRKRLKLTKNIMQTIVERKPNMFGHICRINDNRLIKITINNLE